MAHEFGHAAFGLEDGSGQRMIVVNGVENRIMNDLGFTNDRISY